MHSFAGVSEIDPRVSPNPYEDLVMKMVLQPFVLFCIDHEEDLLLVTSKIMDTNVNKPDSGDLWAMNIIYFFLLFLMPMKADIDGKLANVFFV